MVARAGCPLLSRLAGDVAGRRDHDGAAFPDAETPSEQTIVSVFAEEAIVPETTRNEVTASSSEKLVVPTASTHAVVPAESEDDVVAAETDDYVPPPSAEEPVIARGSHDGRGSPET